MDGISHSMMIKIPSGFHNRVISRIENFHIICVYDSNKEINRLKPFAKLLVNGEKSSIPLFGKEQEGTSYVISESTYHENQHLFYQLRSLARDNMINRVSTGIVAYFLSEHAIMIQSSMSRRPEMRDLQLLDLAVEKINSVLKNNTFLAEETVWNTFSEWFNSCLANHVISDMAKEFGHPRLEYMDNTVLNETFRERLSQELIMNSNLMAEFIKLLDRYLYQWIAEIIPSIDEHTLSIDQLEKFVGLEPKKNPRREMPIQLPIQVTEDHISVMSNAVYQTVRESLSNRSFIRGKGQQWPEVQIQKGTVAGTIQIRPFDQEAATEYAYKQADALSELVVDVFDTLCSFFLSNAFEQKSIVEIRIHDLLAIRGLKPKRSGSGRRGGYEPEQTAKVLEALSIIQDVWIDFHSINVFKNGRQVEVARRGRPLEFFDNDHQPYDVRTTASAGRLLFTMGDVFQDFLSGASRQVALLPLRALQYNPRQEEWEKKLIRYLSWRWRTQARKERYHQPYKIGSLLQVIGKATDKRTPSRTRDRLEQALDRMQEDGLIASWEYLDWDETTAAVQGWLRLWENTTLIIQPPEIVKEQYRTFAKRPRRVKRESQEINTAIGLQLKNYRERIGLTLTAAAEELGLSAGYLSIIERGKQNPSSHVAHRIMNWTQRAYI